MGKVKKVSKNNPDNKKQTRVTYKTKLDCEKCSKLKSCSDGMKYIERMNKTGKSKCVVCKNG